MTVPRSLPPPDVNPFHVGSLPCDVFSLANCGPAWFDRWAPFAGVAVSSTPKWHSERNWRSVLLNKLKVPVLVLLCTLLVHFAPIQPRTSGHEGPSVAHRRWPRRRPWRVDCWDVESLPGTVFLGGGTFTEAMGQEACGWRAGRTLAWLSFPPPTAQRRKRAPPLDRRMDPFPSGLGGNPAHARPVRSE